MAIQTLDELTRAIRQLPREQKITLWKILDAELVGRYIDREFDEAVKAIKMKLWQMLSRLFAIFVRRNPRVVLDTNVLISATLSEQGFSAIILRAIRQRRLRVIVSPYILNEYLNVVRRPHIAKKYKEIGERIDALIRFLNVRAILVAGQPIERVISDDPKDDAILACAVQGQAQYIVSGDEHIKQLAAYRGIKILSPRDFATQILHDVVEQTR
ncbi:MAG: putative toxin-antitoxin system toxin component, PIN family [Chloroflexi bacterium]|nr:putative toxin-antitoxin system toxin component, PIN family [Chloroflexota bacterium]